MAFLNVRCSLWVESLGTLYQQVGTAQLFPAVPLTEQFTSTLVEDEIDEPFLCVGNAQLCQDGLIFCWQLTVAGNLQVRRIGSTVDAS